MTTRRGSFRDRLLAELQAGPVTLQRAYQLAGSKRSAVSRLSEMRARGEIVDLIAVSSTPPGKKAPNPA
mgnify:CR=1 FL=1